MSRRVKIIDYKISELLLLFLSVSILFMHPLKNLFPLFSFVDELVVIICLFALSFRLISQKRVENNESKIIMFFLLFVGVGLISNLNSHIERPINAVLTDIFGFSKCIIVSLGGFYLFKRKVVIDQIFSFVVLIVRCLVIIGVICAIINQFYDLGMRDDYRYGIYCFKYIYDTAAIFSWYCYMYLLVLSIDLLKGISRKKIIYISLNMVMWILTGRSRGFAFIAIYLILVIILRMNEVRKTQMKIRLRYFIILGLLAVFVAWNQVIFYFTTETEARNILLVVGGRITKQYFPLGSGLATFGTAAAQKYYSPVYGMYGINMIYGFTSDNPLYLTDTFWPAVFGETGIIGGVLFGFALFNTFKHLYQKVATNNISKFIMIFVIVSLIGSSIATSVFAQNATVGDLFYLCMIPSLLGDSKENGKNS